MERKSTSKTGSKPSPAASSGHPTVAKPAKPVPAGTQPADPAKPEKPVEIGGPSGPEPTRYGDWERNGRVSDF
ncbi:DUF1674 domain-containing protein [Dongia soli]|uniref:DUF1674 domain-containing protein n=1 Tax=Dongia soli TaxID=600628 RepID=A0ABU5E6E4_9PROT|nr:DUF1674 domain-containing protein [Dongia soli]MDY0881850.1 DUF1674 domain-containing protein [Dongia soli]